jgi:hypothetical protein
MRADCFCNNKGPSEIYWDCFYQVVNACARTHDHILDIERTYERVRRWVTLNTYLINTFLEDE